MKKIILSMIIAAVVIFFTPLNIIAFLCAFIVVGGVIAVLFGLYAVPIYYILNYLSKLHNNKAGTEGRKELEEKE